MNSHQPYYVLIKVCYSSTDLFRRVQINERILSELRDELGMTEEEARAQLMSDINKEIMKHNYRLASKSVRRKKGGPR